MLYQQLMHYPICKNSRRAVYICTDPSCHRSPLICELFNCICTLQQHQNCQTMEWVEMIQKFGQTKLRCEQDLKLCNEIDNMLQNIMKKMQIERRKLKKAFNNMKQKVEEISKLSFILDKNFEKIDKDLILQIQKNINENIIKQSLKQQNHKQLLNKITKINIIINDTFPKQSSIHQSRQQKQQPNKSSIIIISDDEQNHQNFVKTIQRENFNANQNILQTKNQQLDIQPPKQPSVLPSIKIKSKKKQNKSEELSKLRLDFENYKQQNMEYQNSQQQKISMLNNLVINLQKKYFQIKNQIQNNNSRIDTNDNHSWKLSTPKHKSEKKIAINSAIKKQNSDKKQLIIVEEIQNINSQNKTSIQSFLTKNKKILNTIFKDKVVKYNTMQQIQSALNNVKQLNLQRSDFTLQEIKDIPVLPNLQILNINDKNIGINGVQILCNRFKKLIQLHLRNNRINNPSLDLITTQFPNLLYLDLQSTSNKLETEDDLYGSLNNIIQSSFIPSIQNQITFQGIQYLIRLKNLTHLNLAMNMIGDQGIQLITNNIPKLVMLNLAHNKINLKSMQQIVLKLSSLKDLNLSHNQMTIEMINELTKLKELNILSLASTELDKKKVKQIVRIKSLRQLIIPFNNIGKQGAILISELNLITLNLEDNKIGNDGAIKIFLNMKTLKNLNLATNKLNKSAFQKIESLRINLISLNLRNNKINKESALFISKLKQLNELILTDTSIQKDSIIVICKALPKLNILHLGNTIIDQNSNFNEQCAIAISTLLELTSLNLNGHKITDKGVEMIMSKCKQLAYLNLKSTAITEEYKQKLKNNLIQTNIILEI